MAGRRHGPSNNKTWLNCQTNDTVFEGWAGQHEQPGCHQAPLGSCMPPPCITTPRAGCTKPQVRACRDECNAPLRSGQRPCPHVNGAFEYRSSTQASSTPASSTQAPDRSTQSLCQHQLAQKSPILFGETERGSMKRVSACLCPFAAHCAQHRACTHFPSTKQLQQAITSPPLREKTATAG